MEWTRRWRRAARGVVCQICVACIVHFSLVPRIISLRTPNISGLRPEDYVWWGKHKVVLDESEFRACCVDVDWGLNCLSVPLIRSKKNGSAGNRGLPTAFQSSTAAQRGTMCRSLPATTCSAFRCRQRLAIWSPSCCRTRRRMWTPAVTPFRDLHIASDNWSRPTLYRKIVLCYVPLSNSIMQTDSTLINDATSPP